MKIIKLHYNISFQNYSLQSFTTVKKSINIFLLNQTEPNRPVQRNCCIKKFKTKIKIELYEKVLEIV